MSTLKRIVKNAGVTFFGNNLLKVLSMVLIILIARYLGDVEYGKFTFAISFTGLFFILMDMGTRILIVRDIAKQKDKAPKIVANVLMFKLITSVIVYGVIIAVAYMLQYNKETIMAVAIAALGLVFDSFSTTIGSIYQAYERLEFPVVTKTIRILIRLAITIPILLAGMGFFPVLIIYTGVQLLNLMVNLVICYTKFVSLNFDFDKEMIISILRRAFPFFLSGIFVTVYFRIDITLMSKLAPLALKGVYENVSRDAVIGWYSSAYNLLDAATSLPVAVSAAILPVAITFYRDSKDKLKELYHLSIKYLTYLSVPMAFGITLLADKIIILLYKQDYSNATLSLQILIWTMIPLCINYMMGAFLIAVHQEKKGVIVLFLNAVVNFVLNLFLIPKYSLYGAAAATVLTELFYFGGYYYIMSKHLAPIDFPDIFLRPMLASALMAAVILLLIQFNLFILAGIGIVTYGLTLLLLGAFDYKDFKFIERVIDIIKRR